jgi:UDP-N-acetylglucosamine 2-epimerase (non-hydrolysing)
MVYPVHPNPNVRAPAQELLGGHARILLTQPLDYLDLVHALKRAALVITDSGGIQEEAPSFGAPVLVLREVTERPEGIRAGVARLVGTDREAITRAAAEVLTGSGGPAARTRPNPYGDGRAAGRIADILAHGLTGRPRRTSDWEGVA